MWHGASETINRLDNHKLEDMVKASSFSGQIYLSCLVWHDEVVAAATVVSSSESKPCWSGYPRRRAALVVGVDDVDVDGATRAHLCVRRAACSQLNVGDVCIRR